MSGAKFAPATTGLSVGCRVHPEALAAKGFLPRARGPCPPSTAVSDDRGRHVRRGAQLTVILSVKIGAAPAPGNAEPTPLLSTRVTL